MIHNKEILVLPGVNLADMFCLFKEIELKIEVLEQLTLTEFIIADIIVVLYLTHLLNSFYSFYS